MLDYFVSRKAGKNAAGVAKLASTHSANPLVINFNQLAFYDGRHLVLQLSFGLILQRVASHDSNLRFSRHWLYRGSSARLALGR
jgi:hypothetical protein